MTEHPSDLITANRTRRERWARRRTFIIAGAVSLYVGSLLLDRALGFSSDGGSAPFMSVLVGGVEMGLLWTEARRWEGVEQVVLTRAALIAAAGMALFATGGYVTWLIADASPAPRAYLTAAGLSLMLGYVVAGFGLGDDDQ